MACLLAVLGKLVLSVYYIQAYSHSEINVVTVRAVNAWVEVKELGKGPIIMLVGNCFARVPLLNCIGSAIVRDANFISRLQVTASSVRSTVAIHQGQRGYVESIRDHIPAVTLRCNVRSSRAGRGCTKRLDRRRAAQLR